MMTMRKTKLSGAQGATLHSIFRRLRTEYGQDEVDADKIIGILNNTDGQRRRLVGLNHVSHFKSDAIGYAHVGYVGDAEEVFKEVARVICGLGSPPHDWQVARLHTSPKRQPYGDGDDYSPLDISEVFTWTHGGIEYEVSSDAGDDNWYFRGTTVHDRRHHDARFSGGNAPHLSSLNHSVRRGDFFG